MPNRAALAKIHIAKKELNLSDDNYRDMLSGFGVGSSKDLSEKQADEFLTVCKKLGWKPKSSRQSTVGNLPDGKAGRQKGKIVITVPDNRPEEFATQKQVNMLAGMWYYKSREKTAESFMKFVYKIAGVNHPQWLLKSDVERVKKGIEVL